MIAGLKGRVSILLVEQYDAFARLLADRYVVLNRGTVVAGGPAEDMDRDRIARFLSI